MCSVVESNRLGVWVDEELPRFFETQRNPPRPRKPRIRVTVTERGRPSQTAASQLFGKHLTNGESLIRLGRWEGGVMRR